MSKPITSSSSSSSASPSSSSSSGKRRLASASVKRSKKSKQTRTNKRKTTRQHLDGSKTIHEETQVDQHEVELIAAIRADYVKSVQDAQERTITESVDEIIKKDPYCQWRQQRTLDTVRKFKAWFDSIPDDKKVDMVWLHQHRPTNIYDDAFLAVLPWQNVIEYAQAAYKMDNAIYPDDTPQKAVYLEKFIGRVLVDKVLMSAIPGALTDPIWPTCVSTIKDIESLQWRGPNDFVKVVPEMMFRFDFSPQLPPSLQGYSFTPAKYFFPLSIMRIVPVYRKLYHQQLDADRQVIEHDPNLGTSHAIFDQMTAALK